MLVGEPIVETEEPLTTSPENVFKTNEFGLSESKVIKESQNESEESRSEALRKSQTMTTGDFNDTQAQQTDQQVQVMLAIRDVSDKSALLAKWNP